MAKLKTFTVELGFYELAVAAQSMKGALERWGLKHNAFHQGFAKVTTDPKAIAAANEQPGLVLRRPIGSKGNFKKISDEIKPPSGKEGVRRKARKRIVDRKQVKLATQALRVAEQAHRKRVARLEKELSRIRQRMNHEEEEWLAESARLRDDLANAKNLR